MKTRLVSLAFGLAGAGLCLFLYSAYLTYQQHMAMWNLFITNQVVLVGNRPVSVPAPEEPAPTTKK